MNPLLILLLLGLLTVSSTLLAAEDLSEEEAILQAIEAYEERSWELGLAAGYGVKTNPLVNSNDIPMYAVLNVAWFGDYFFFDNGDVGANIYQADKLSVNVIAHLNNEREVFEWLNDKQLGVDFFSIAAASFAEKDAEVSLTETLANPLEVERGIIQPESESTEIEPTKRSLAVDGGLEIMYSDDWGDIQLQLLSDVSFTHKGFEMWASYAFPWQQGDWRIIPSIGVNWKSRHFLNYYYGVGVDEAVGGRFAYQAGSGFNHFIKLAVSYRIDDNWGMVGVMEYEHLSASIRHSPIVNQESIKTAFIGLMYNF